MFGLPGWPRRTLRRVLAILTFALAAITFGAAPASAHGENTQQAFIRLSTIVFYDVQFSTSDLRVGDELTVTGKFRVMNAWPDHTVAQPDIAYLTVVVPGPVFLAEERVVSGQFTPQSFRIKKGGTYPFKIRLQARTPGRWHVHPALAVEGTGTLVGPGQWITIREGGEVKNDLTLLSGKTVDLTSYGLGRVVGWHLVGAVFGIAWILYWIRRPLFTRALGVWEGRGASLVSNRDRIIGVAFAVAALATGIGGYVYANVKDPHTIPLQIARIVPPPEGPNALDSALDIDVRSASYSPNAKRLTLVLDAKNSGTIPVRLSQMNFGEVTLANRATKPDAKYTFTTSPAEPIGPGESRTVTVTVQGKFIEDMHLIPLDEAQIRITGLLFFEDATGQRTEVEINELTSPIRPDFGARASARGRR